MYFDRRVELMVLEKIKNDKVIAIFRNVPMEKLFKQVDLLIENGIRLLEVTLNSDEALESISKLNSRYGDAICLGAGTVTNVEDVEKVKNLGAEFIISPNVNIEVIKETKRLGLVSIPGAFTPTEIFTAHQNGADMIKVFPASTLGLDFAKSVSGPFPDISLMATGGIDENNAHQYINSGYEAVGIGSSLTSMNLEDMEEVKRKLSLYRELQIN